MFATFERAVDGDTLILWLRVSDDVKIRRRCRLKGIDSHEPTGDAAHLARDIADKINALLMLEELTVFYTSGHDDRYGRALISANWGTKDLAELFVVNGWAWHFGDADKVKHAARNHAFSLKQLGKLAAASACMIALASACHAPAIQTGGSTYVSRPATITATPKPTTLNATTNKQVPDEVKGAETDGGAVIILHGGQLTRTGNDSPVSATATSEPIKLGGGWKSYAVAFVLGALTLLLVEIGFRLGWRAVISAAKAAI